MDYSNYLKNEKNARRENVLLTAAQLFLENGIDNVKMTDVAAGCNMGVASLYRYFGTKTRMLVLTAELLWRDIQELFRQVLEDKNYTEKSGNEQLREIFSFFPSLLSQQRGFIKFIHEFDEAILKEKVPPEELEEYEATVLSFYPHFEAAYNKGLEDGSLHRIDDFKLFYFTATHSLLLMCQKFVYNGILKSDTEAGAFDEIALMVNIVMQYLKNA